jgi:uncharacterized protein (UPF0332 family)
MPWRDHLQKALTNLHAAELCHQENLPDPAVSRAYYSVFHAAIAALLRFSHYPLKGENWNHADVQAEFNRRLIARQKKFPMELGRISADLINYRHVADYRRRTVGQKIAGRCVEKARRFVTDVEKKLQEAPTDVAGA